MYLTTLPLDAAVGKLLCHNIPDPQGRKAFKKGHCVVAADLAALRELGYEQLRVAVLEQGDVHENEAAAALVQTLAGAGTVPSRAAAGRGNLLAAERGLLDIDLAALEAVNAIDGLAVATLRRHRVVEQQTILATVKIIPYAVPAASLQIALAAGANALRVLPLLPLAVGLVLVGHPSAERRVRAGVEPAIVARVTELGGRLLTSCYVVAEEQAVRRAIEAGRAAGAELLMLAGETSVMDATDVIPEALRAAGGRIIHYGAPVEPGNLLLLAELPGLGEGPPLPIIGAPGCVRSRNANVVDLILPRLLAGQRLAKGDIVALGHGGLLG